MARYALRYRDGPGRQTDLFAQGAQRERTTAEERAAKCDLYVNLTHKIIDSGSYFLYNLYVNLTG